MNAVVRLFETACRVRRGVCIAFKRRTLTTGMTMMTGDGYELDTDKIDDTVLALLSLTMCGRDRAWKGHDWDALGRLHEKGMIYDPVGKAKSVSLTPEGLERCERLFRETFFRKK